MAGGTVGGRLGDGQAEAGEARSLGRGASRRCWTCCWSTSPRRPTSPSTRCRRSSPTSTPPPTSGVWRSAACATGASAAASRSRGAAPTAPIERAQVSELYVTEALERVDAAEAGPGEIIAVAGIAEVTIGETLADPDDPRPLPVITVDEPSISITLGINTSPMAGREGSKVTARQLRDRLDAELIGNVSLRVRSTPAACGSESWEVQGRGELQLGVLVEIMRREGFELTVGQPRVLERTIDGKRHEPVERLSIDVPEEFVGVVTQMLALRKGRMEHMTNHGTGWVRMDYLVPARGLIGFRTEFITETRGTGMMHHVFDRWERWAGEMRTRASGALIADRRGETVAVRADEPAGARHACSSAPARRCTRG